MSLESGDYVYLFESGAAAMALTRSKKKRARDLLVAFIHLRIHQLGWDIGRVIAKRGQLTYIAEKLNKKLEGRDLLVIDLDPRICLRRIEL